MNLHSLWFTLSAEITKQHRNRVKGRAVFFTSTLAGAHLFNHLLYYAAL